MRTSALFLLALPAFAISACGEKDVTDDTEDSDADTDTDADSDTDADTDADSDTDVEKDWVDMDFDERKAYMNSTVLPTMKTKFQEYDAEAYANFNCATCHGGGAQDGTFAMPTADLPVLEFANVPTPGDGGVNDFMYDVCAPEMVTLLGYEPFDPNTGEGFGCLQCHTGE